jgi:hypothetical protein
MMLGYNLGSCTYLVGAPFDSTFLAGDANVHTLIDHGILNPIGEEEAADYGYSCSKGKMWVARNPFVYGWGWEEAGWFMGVEGYHQQVNDAYSGEFEQYWQERKAFNGGFWAYP